MTEELTAIRKPNDIDKLEEAAWSILEQSGWIATPQLLFALKAQLQQEQDAETNGKTQSV